jgi:hypothetical protein
MLTRVIIALLLLQVVLPAAASARPVTLAEVQQRDRLAAAYQDRNVQVPSARALIHALYSPAGLQASQRLLTAARQHKREGTASPFELALVAEVQKIKHRQYAPKPGEEWRRWAKQRKVNKVPSALLNVLGDAFFRSTHPADSLPWHPEEWLDHVRLDKSVVRDRFGAAGLQTVETLLSTLPRDRAWSPEVKQSLSMVNQWSLLNGLNPRMEKLLADEPGFAPPLPVVEHEVRTEGRLPGTIKGALVQWPGRANTYTALKGMGLPANTVVYGDKLHFLDPRFMLALSNGSGSYQLRGQKVTSDTAFLERWVRQAIEPYQRLSPEALKREPVRFLMLGDGGYLVKTVNRLMLRTGLERFAHLFAFEEQTGSGSNLLAKEKKLLFHGIDIARGADKAVEGPDLYGYVVGSQLAREYSGLKAQGVTLGKNVTIMGAGKDGRGVGMGAAEHLAKAGYSVTVYDINPDSLSKAKQAARDPRIRFASEPLEAMKSADALLTFTAGKLAFGKKTMEALAKAVPQGRTLLVMNGGSPGEIQRLPRTAEERRNTRVDRFGIVRAKLGETTIALGHSDSGPDLDRVVPYGNWRFILPRNGIVCNGRTRILGNSPRLMNETRIFEGSSQVLRREIDTDNPTPDHLFDEELARLIRGAHAAAKGGAPGLKPLGAQQDLKAFRQSTVAPTQRW